MECKIDVAKLNNSIFEDRSLEMEEVQETFSFFEVSCEFAR